MIDFTIELDERALNARLQQFPAALAQRLRVTIERLTTRLRSAVIAAEPKRTGALERATRSFIHSTDDFVRGSVKIMAGPDGKHNVKAAALEYGVHAWIDVRPYEMLREHFESPISGYKRRVDIAGRHFLADPLAEITPEARAEIEEAVKDATHGVVA